MSGFMVFRRLRTLANGGNSYAEVKLLESAISGDLCIAEIDEALFKGVDINCAWVKSPTIGSADQTPLITYCSSLQAKSEVVEHLLARGANANIKAKYGHTALSLLTSGRFSVDRIKILRALIAAGARPDSVNASGETPLHCLARTGSIEEITCLLEVSSKRLVNYAKYVPNGKGYAPLHCAVSASGGPPGQSRVPVIKLLIEYGADINQKTKGETQKTPLELAKGELEESESASAMYQEDPHWLKRQKKDKKEMVGLIRSLGANQSEMK
ncbi:ankyrin repeat domain-containing protein [Roseovarius tibetensis]|uniref:ankyrin repeat domain-containing protein n=1 Tax=Roseovarius tibetensis TaxID=2685897 RepID=UPI003D7FF261